MSNVSNEECQDATCRQIRCLPNGLNLELTLHSNVIYYVRNEEKLLQGLARVASLSTFANDENISRVHLQRRERILLEQRQLCSDPPIQRHRSRSFICLNALSSL